MRAKDIMVTEVITVGPQASVRDVAKLLLSNRISALPVVDEHGELIGIISEGDLARRAELGTNPHRSWWLEMFSRKSKEALAKEYLKSRGSKVRDVMTKNVITAKPTTSLRDIATLLEKHRIKRVPIVAKGKMIGIVSRANLIQALASLPKDTKRNMISDSRVRKKVVKQLQAEKWAKGSLLNVTVHNGMVKLWGIVDTEAEKEAVRVAVELVEGVRAIENNVTVLPVVADS
jgi:CBS-domain-containing membrane protein